MDCPFCNIDSDIILSSDLWYVVYDRYPVSPRHVLGIPFRHFTDYFELLEDELNAIWKLVGDVKNFLSREYKPGG